MPQTFSMGFKSGLEGGGGGVCAPPVDLLFLEITLSPSASMLGIIVLLESMLHWVILRDERNQCFVQNVSVPICS